MGGRWNLLGFQLHKVLCVVLMIQLLGEDCLSLNLEGLALLEFRSKVENDPYGALKNWNKRDRSPCNWTGVHCVDGKVVMLELKDFSLRGILSPEIGNLSHLRALVLFKNNFFGAIPMEIARVTMLELLDLRNNELNGTIPKEIREMLSLKHLLLHNNKFQDGTPLTESPNTNSYMIHEQYLPGNFVEMARVNKKVGHRFWENGLQNLKIVYSDMIQIRGRITDILFSHLKFLTSVFVSSSGPSNANNGRDITVASGVGDRNLISNMHDHAARRKLLEDSRNLPAASISISPVAEVVTIPPSGSFPAIPKVPKPSQDPLPSQSPPDPPSPLHPNHAGASKPPASKSSTNWIFLFVLPVGATLLIFFICILLAWHRKDSSQIGPWRTGLSGQLQKAFVTGAPTLKRSELEAACEDFSNIITSFPDFTVYKGTLSSGVEISVASTTVASAENWSSRSETLFRKKIDTLSRLNHKNFLNLLGYCEEDKPFTRMMVLEYAPNGTLCEHLHVEEFDHLDWNARVRIIMGSAYCLQYMHELSPPIYHPNLLSLSILITEDYAAKILDFSVWKEVIAKGKSSGDDDSINPKSSPANSAANVYSLGLLLLEIISGKDPQEESSSFLDMVGECLEGNRNIGSLVDPSLKSHKAEELDVICRVIHYCTNPDPRKRPKMNEVVSTLREVIAISPEAATPRLSPLWWAELEILSVEAS